MTIRTLTLLTLVTVSVASTGCSGMRNFFFGRGANCGLCNRVGAIGRAVNPFAPPPPPSAGGCNTGSCGLFNRGQAVVPPPVVPQQPVYTPAPAYVPYAAPQASAGTCTTCPPVQPYVGDGCGGEYMSSSSGYYEGTVDPYLGSGTIGYGETIVPGSYSDQGVIQGDSFGPRVMSNRYDIHGDEIIHADPLPPGAQLVD
ncbi:hypothetical protein LOC71_00670 [Rhodopirellula sp. JC740]|uniref:Uncharacterized protein n=2 Tax=Rhodopirellula halodulae TaxID=2894198 RepID=A0ABS8NB22_9BACT|nr:hypothetical protein [Rhodopirellula sp. JC740]